LSLCRVEKSSETVWQGSPSKNELTRTDLLVIMTRLLEKAFEKASELPEGEQDDFAAFILEELQAERRWSQAFQRSQDELAKLAQEALDEHRSGTSEKLDTDRL
jgi:hypothetical protein